MFRVFIVSVFILSISFCFSQEVGVYRSILKTVNNSYEDAAGWSFSYGIITKRNIIFIPQLELYLTDKKTDFDNILGSTEKNVVTYGLGVVTEVYNKDNIFVRIGADIKNMTTFYGDTIFRSSQQNSNINRFNYNLNLTLGIENLFKVPALALVFVAMPGKVNEAKKVLANDQFLFGEMNVLYVKFGLRINLNQPFKPSIDK
ncbi:MAG: hypothetical protein ACJAZ3_002003 [Sphingobacteriales bacterium]|jgi:hypothetical protein